MCESFSSCSQFLIGTDFYSREVFHKKYQRHFTAKVYVGFHSLYTQEVGEYQVFNDGLEGGNRIAAYDKRVSIYAEHTPPL